MVSDLIIATRVAATLVAMSLVLQPSSVNACMTAHVDVFTQADRAAGIAIVQTDTGYSDKNGRVRVLEHIRGDENDSYFINISSLPKPGDDSLPIRLDMCGSAMLKGARYLAFVDEKGRELNILNESLIRLDRSAGVPDPEGAKMLMAVRRWVASTDANEKIKMLTDMVSHVSSYSVGKDAALHLFTNPAVLARATPEERSRLIAAMTAARHFKNRNNKLEWAMVRVHDQEALPYFLGRLVKTKSKLLISMIELLTNHLEPTGEKIYPPSRITAYSNRLRSWKSGQREPVELRDYVSRWLRWYANQAEVSREQMILKGFRERGLTVKSLDDRAGLAAVLTAETDLVARLVALDLCEQTLGRNLFLTSLVWWIIEPGEASDYMEKEILEDAAKVCAPEEPSP